MYQQPVGGQVTSRYAPDRLVVILNTCNGERAVGTSYSVTASKLWNELHSNVKKIKSLDTLKNQICDWV